MSSPKSYNHIHIGDGTELYIAKIRTFEELQSEVSATELEEVVAFVSPKRRAERLAWRALLREALEVPLTLENLVQYDAIGAPHLVGFPQYISVSHCAEYVAIVISQSPCAVDIEPLDRNFAKVQSRYVSEQELLLITSEQALCRMWCAKESLYKFAGQEGLSLLGDITIESINPTHMQCHIKGHNQPITVHILDFAELVVALIF